MLSFPGTLVLAAALALVPGWALAEHEHDHAHLAPEKLGQVHFPTSCKPESKPAFERGLALLHSFAYAQSATVFQEVSAKDPGCGLAQWGVAMTYFHTIWGPPTEDEFAAGRTAAQKAAAVGAPSAREGDYIAAIGAYYQGEGVAHPTRVVAYEKAMAGVAERNPDDHEAQIFHALAILGVAYNSPPDKTYTRQKEAAKILNQLLALEPNHPGIAHYMIHSFDYPGLAELALPAARAYAKIAPSAAHALHMPSHIFTRLGMWKESIDSNLASAQTAQAWVAKTHAGATAFDALHATDYLEYAYLQTGQDAKARELVENVAKVTSFDVPQFAAGYALAAVPARHALERRAWKEAAALTAQPATFPWAKYPYAEAIVHFARAVGGARAGALDTARREVARLADIQAALKGCRHASSSPTCWPSWASRPRRSPSTRRRFDRRRRASTAMMAPRRWPNAPERSKKRRPSASSWWRCAVGRCRTASRWRRRLPSRRRDSIADALEVAAYDSDAAPTGVRLSTSASSVRLRNRIQAPLDLRSAHLQSSRR